MKFRDLSLILAIFGILVGVAFFAVVISNKGQEHELFSGSTYSNKPTGCKAFYLFVKEMGFDARRWQLPLNRLKAAANQGQAMVVIDVLGSSLGRYGLRDINKDLEFSDLFNWVRRGNSLILIGDSPYLRSKNLNTEIVWADYPQNNDEDKIVARPALPTIYGRKLDKIKLSRYARLKPKRADRVVHFQDAAGEIVVSLSEGKGKIILISDPYIVYNQGIAEDDNILLLANIISRESPSKIVYFDEFDKGFYSEKGLFAYFKGTSFGWVFLHFLLCAGLYFYSKGRHFGIPWALAKKPRRSVLEYIDALAGIYQKAQAYQLGLIGIYRRYKALWLRSLGFESRWDIGEFCRVIAMKIDRNKNEIQKLFNECEEVVKGTSISRSQALSLAKELQKLRKELGDAGIH